MGQELCVINHFLKKILHYIPIILGVVFLLIQGIMFLLILSLWLYPQLWGSRDLGDGLYLIDGDHLEDRVIVYGTNIEGNACFGGEVIIPSIKKKYPSDYHRIELFVSDALSDDKWVIAVLINPIDDTRHYAVFDKRFLSICNRNWSDHVEYFDDLEAFDRYCEESEINLKF